MIRVAYKGMTISRVLEKQLLGGGGGEGEGSPHM